MTYPVNEQAFVTAYLSNIDNPDDVDRQVAEATARIINRAYHTGLAEGREENALN